MKKKRIFIAIHYLEIGGAEISLIGLLNAIDYSRYEVDLFVYSHQGELMKLIPKEVNLLPEIPKYAQIEQPMTSVLKRGYVDVVLARLWARFKYHQYIRKYKPQNSIAAFQYIFDAVTPLLPSINKQICYDLAISFLIPHNIVLEKVRAKKKVAWIHTDYSWVSVHAEQELPVWSRYDYIASISADVTKSFLKTFPSLKDKIVLIENILSKDLVFSRAKEKSISFPKKEGRINLLSIGRFSSQKNFDNVPDICRLVRELGRNIYWYIIGYGVDEALIRQRIEEAGMQDYVILLGKKENPYPYIVACDLYVQPSRYEGKAVTVREAQMLGKPVVITDFPTASSQLKNGVDGLIVPLENKACAEGISDFILNRELQHSFIQFLKEHDYGNEKEVEKIYQLIS